MGVVAPRETGPQGQVVGLSYLTSALVNEALVSVAGDGRIVPRLVERWERSADGRSWRFHLKQGVRFHTGELLTTSVILPELQAHLRELIGAQSVRMIDETSFEIVQGEPSSLLLDTLITVPIASGANSRAGTGPFVPTPASEDTVAFRAFDEYHRGKPTIERVGLRQYDNQRMAWAALMRRDIDVLYEVSPEARDFVETESTITVSTFLRPYTMLVAFNLNNATFKDSRLRRALNLAIDRDEVVRIGLRGHGEAAYDHLWPNHWAVDPARSAYRRDTAAALDLLRASGHGELRKETPDRMPSRLAFHCLVYAPLERLALAVQRQLALVGVDMSIELLSLPQMGARIASGQFEAFLFELTNVRTLGYTYLFWHSQSESNVRTGYSAADAALDQIRVARNDDELRAAVRALQDVMKNDPPAIFIAYPEMARAVSNEYGLPGGDEDIFHTIARWTTSGAEDERR